MNKFLAEILEQPGALEKTLNHYTSFEGESFEIVELLKTIPESAFCIGITNEEQSTLARTANIVLLSKAGKEEMTSTKTYVSTTLVSFILGWSMAGKWNDNFFTLLPGEERVLTARFAKADLGGNEPIVVLDMN